MRPRDVLELRADLAAKATHPLFRSSMVGTIAASTGAHIPTVARVRNERAVGEATRIVEFLPQMVKDAVNFYVAPDMTDLVMHAASMLDATDVADLTLVPAQTGFVYFDRPLVITDIRQESINVSALLWDINTYGQCIVHMWDDEYEHPDAVALQDRTLVPEDIRKIFGRWGYVGIAVLKDGDQIGDIDIEVSEALHNYYADVEGVTGEPYTNPLRLVHALWLLLGQTLVSSVVERGDRRALRRMRFMDLPGDVTVITLRHRENSDGYEGESHVEWSHRWLVRGFWRWQPYKDEDGVWQHRRQWINPYIKGPADKPLVITQKVNAFTR